MFDPRGTRADVDQQLLAAVGEGLQKLVEKLDTVNEGVAAGTVQSGSPALTSARSDLEKTLSEYETIQNRLVKVKQDEEREEQRKYREAQRLYRDQAREQDRALKEAASAQQKEWKEKERANRDEARGLEQARKERLRDVARADKEDERAKKELVKQQQREQQASEAASRTAREQVGEFARAIGRGGFGFARSVVQAGSPTGLSTFEKSWKLVQMEFTGLFLPAIVKASKGLQDFAKSLREKGLAKTLVEETPWWAKAGFGAYIGHKIAGGKGAVIGAALTWPLTAYQLAKEGARKRLSWQQAEYNRSPEARAIARENASRPIRNTQDAREGKESPLQALARTAYGGGGLGWLAEGRFGRMGTLSTAPLTNVMS